MLPASYGWPTPETLSELVRDAQRDPQGVDVLLTTIRPALHTFFRQDTDADAAEDLTQLSLVRITGAVARIVPERADSYLSAIARNMLRTSYRVRARDRRRTSMLTDAIEVAADEVADGSAEYEDLAHAVHDACLRIEQPALRDIALGVLRGYSTSELANEFAISPITVRTRLMRIRTSLRRELAPYLDEEHGA
ncbi:MAG TPA: sigma-70 family RNA polymerase sigma factor [Gemmatimonadaceae bacterium]|jgi:RNA polymerase sigma factor (sigma-70 family)